MGYCATCEKQVTTYQHWKNPRITVGRYRQQYVYRCDYCYSIVEPDAAPAASIIDWNLDCPKIGDRDRPLKSATLRRIEKGLQKFSNPQFNSFLVQYNGKSHAASLQDPLPTVTTVERCALVNAHFLIQYYGRANAASSIELALPTITTENRHALIKGDVCIEACGFRMLQPHELKLAMGFQSTYSVLGNKKQQVKQIGNAVTPGALQWQIQRGVDSLINSEELPTFRHYFG